MCLKGEAEPFFNKHVVWYVYQLSECDIPCFVQRIKHQESPLKAEMRPRRMKQPLQTPVHLPPAVNLYIFTDSLSFYHQHQSCNALQFLLIDLLCTYTKGFHYAYHLIVTLLKKRQTASKWSSIYLQHSHRTKSVSRTSTQKNALSK